MTLPSVPPGPSSSSLAASPGPAIVEAWARGKKPSTLRAYRRCLQGFARFVGVGSLGDAAQVLLAHHGRANGLALEYIEALKTRGLSASNIGQHVSALSSVVEVARMLGVVNWALEVPRPKAKPYKDTSGPSDEAVFRILAYFEERLSVRRANIKLRRDYAMVRLMLSAGLRRSEVVSLDIDHLDFSHRGVHLLGKGRYERELMKVGPETMAALRAWMEVHPAPEYPPLFISVDPHSYAKRLTGDGLYFVLMDLRKRLGIKDRLNPHGFRHKLITQTADLTGDTLTSTAVARHSDPKVTMAYIDNLADRQGTGVRGVEADLRGKYEDWKRGQPALDGRGSRP